MLRALGAEVVLVPQTPGGVPGEVSGEDLELVEQRAAELTEELRAFRPDKFNNRSGVAAHEETTGPEIWEQTAGAVDAFVASIGTAGTFVGVARALKKRNPAIRCVAAEPARIRRLAGCEVVSTHHKIQGTGYNMVPPLLGAGVCDEYVVIPMRTPSERPGSPRARGNLCLILERRRRLGRPANRPRGARVVHHRDHLPGHRSQGPFNLFIPRIEHKEHTNMKPKNTICLWFDKDAQEAARFYAATFPNSEVTAVHKAPGDFPSGKQGDVLTVEFTVLGIPCLGLNGGPQFKHSEAFSFQIATDTQEETDRYWNAIVGNGGQESECGWCKDRWGLSWQITPRALTDALAAGGAEAKRAFDAMMTMKKIDIATIEAARRG